MAGCSLKSEAQVQCELPRARQQAACPVRLSLMILCLAAVLCTGPATASTHPGVPSRLQAGVCGDILESTWTVENSPYLVTCDATLPSHAALTIEPGVEIRFQAGFGLTVAGTLTASGTPDQPITFTSDLAEPAPNDWLGLQFVMGGSDSRLSWCVIEYATTGVHIYAGPGETVSPVFSYCTVRQNSLHGMLIEGEAVDCDPGLAEPTITGGRIEHNGGYGIYVHGYGDPYDSCDPRVAGAVGGGVSGSVIRRNQNAGIYLHSEEDNQGHGDVWIAIEANIISGNSGHGLHLYGDDPVHPHIENNLIFGNSGSGILSAALPGDADLFVANNTVVGNGEDGVAFNKSAERVHLINNIVVENGNYGLVCMSTSPQAASNDLWGNAVDNYDRCGTGFADISADPWFVDAATGDFRLRFGSPCIDAGTRDGAATTDIDGVTRPQGEEVDIGAHEFRYKGTFLPLMLRE